MNVFKTKGKVIIAGAGPGDPDLITVKAVKYLAAADVVLTDRLVSEDILQQYVPASAEIVYVGKQCRRGSSVPQSTTNELIVKFALQGKTVVRLKGGDVGLFSNVMDELEVLVEHGIDYILVPGVTAGMGAAAYAGIPLTARGYSTAVRFLTCYKSDIVPETYWPELAATDDTLVFYMSGETTRMVVNKLVGENISESKKLAVIEQATTPFQKVHVYELREYLELNNTTEFASPTLLIVGKVVALHDSFSWLTNSTVDQEYFQPIEGKLIKQNGKVERA
jgi:uroporphyrin-III C-methyltransferase